MTDTSLKPLPGDGAVLHHSCERSEHLTHQHTALLWLLQRQEKLNGYRTIMVMHTYKIMEGSRTQLIILHICICICTSLIPRPISNFQRLHAETPDVEIIKTLLGTYMYEASYMHLYGHPLPDWLPP